MKHKWPRHAALATALALAFGALWAAAPASAIVGGHESPSAYPFLGSLQRLDSPRDDLHVCGVTLIAPDWAVTAGHCTRNAADVVGRGTSGHPFDWKVRFGSTAVSSGGELVDVEQFVQLNNKYFDDDVALLKLAHPVQGAPITIADTTPAVGSPIRIMGWGMTCDDVANPDCFPTQLREADTQVQTQASCLADGANFCVGTLDGSVGAANMDSGGPAVIQQSGKWVLAGSTEGAGDTMPTDYTDLTQLRDWIDGYVSGRVPLPPDTPFRSDKLSGTVTIGGACSGSIVESRQSKPTDPAMVMTNGHCTTTRPAVGSATMNQQDKVLVLGRDANGNTRVRAHTTALLYSTMTGTDVAVYRLDTTYQQIEAAGVHVYTMSVTPLQAEHNYSLLSGYAQTSWACTSDSVVPELREGGYTQKDSIRYSTSTDCGTGDDAPTHGTSGSPLVDPATDTIVGIHNTANDYGEQCTADNPCEVDAHGAVTSNIGRRYGQQTYMLNDCLAAGSTLDLTAKGCTLTTAGWPGESTDTGGKTDPTGGGTPPPTTGGGTPTTGQTGQNTPRPGSSSMGDSSIAHARPKQQRLAATGLSVDPLGPTTIAVFAIGLGAVALCLTRLRRRRA